MNNGVCTLLKNWDSNENIFEDLWTDWIDLVYGVDDSGILLVHCVNVLSSGSFVQHMTQLYTVAPVEADADGYKDSCWSPRLGARQRSGGGQWTRRLAVQVFATAKVGPDVIQLQMIASPADSLPFSIYLWHFSVESLSTRVRRTLLRTWLIIAKTAATTEPLYNRRILVSHLH